MKCSDDKWFFLMNPLFYRYFQMGTHLHLQLWRSCLMLSTIAREPSLHTVY
jgi:hypothetical protein